MKRLLAFVGGVAPLFAQYAGPAILSRGDAPAAMSNGQISFRPFVEISGIYDTGLAGVTVNQQGELGNGSSEGLELAFGVSGAHSWQHTQIGLDYRGDFRHYTATSFYDATDQSILLGVKHQFTRHISLNLRNTAGLFSLGTGLVGISQTVPFDPSQNLIPLTDFFDNRTIYASSIADLVIQKTARLSFSFGGGGFLNRRRSTALYGLTGGLAEADVQYRLSRRTTIGANFNYVHYGFRGILSTSDMYTASGTYSIRMTKNSEFSGYAGASRLETKFLQSVPLDPAIAAILGVTSGLRVTYSVRYVPNISARLSRAFPKGVAYISGGRATTPGNGLFLTSIMTSAAAGYTYTGLRRWSFNAQVMYSDGKSIGNFIGNYSDVNGGVGISRQISRSVHTVANFNAHRYGSGSFNQYNRVVYDVRFGIGFAPGDVPIRIW